MKGWETEWGKCARNDERGFNDDPAEVSRSAADRHSRKQPVISREKDHRMVRRQMGGEGALI
jgi:hypothetical protein